jgi:uncharacterized membrane protein SpoIIM required for sporulation
MKVSELLDARRVFWRELEDLCLAMEGRSRRRMSAATVARFSTLYRAACADLALADAYQLPPSTTDYLHQLVARAHNQFYRSRTFNFGGWARELFVLVPQRLSADNCLRLAAVIFWGVFLLAATLAYTTPEFGERTLGKEMISDLEHNFSTPPTGRNAGLSGLMAGFYVHNNPGIGLQCFAFGLLFGIGGLYITLYNAALLGAVFGLMARTPQAENFYQFVTAHAPLELTAIVLSAAAGMRLGFSLIDTQGYTRIASLRRAAKVAMPTVGAAILMFLVAAAIEGFLSASPAPYALKAAAAILTGIMVVFYLAFLGRPRKK